MWALGLFYANASKKKTGLPCHSLAVRSCNRGLASETKYETHGSLQYGEQTSMRLGFVDVKSFCGSRIAGGSVVGPTLLKRNWQEYF